MLVEQTINIIGDVAGRFDELMELLDKMPKADTTVLVGDIIDRGPKSKEVVEWAMANTSVVVLKGNHEAMCIDYFYKKRKYEYGIWEMNGGYNTIHSFKSYGDCFEEKFKKAVEWMESLPLRYEVADGLVVTHAPIASGYSFEVEAFGEFWNRTPPAPMEDKFQVFGHNGGLKQYKDYAICIDDSRNDKLTGMHWPSKQIYQVDYRKI